MFLGSKDLSPGHSVRLRLACWSFGTLQMVTLRMSQCEPECQMLRSGCKDGLRCGHIVHIFYLRLPT